MTNKADEKELASLHGELAKVLKKAIVDGVEVVVDGEVKKVAASPAILNVARQFLKDNKIEAVPAKGSPLGDLSDLPIFDVDTESPYRSQ